ncbi:MAG: sugar phosphate nucleotidyltransferase [Candidatus Hydrogenedentes bacterium]|nr:sugar phosphate nucleotidyltransferase [Candidatus Hydrogenedentota bacterium]
MQIRKAVITAAARGARLYPAADTVQKAMLPLVDRDGLTKPVIQIIAEEALESGIEEIVVICAPGDEESYRRQFRALRENVLEAYRGADWARVQAEKLSALEERLRFAVQSEPLGYGHAVLCARPIVGDEPFLLLLGDHLYVSHVAGRRCAEQLIDLAKQEQCSVAAVQATREHLVGRYGTLTGKRHRDYAGAYQIERIIEKPALSQAETELHTPGLRVGHYLCFFGMYVLMPSIFALLNDALRSDARRGDVALTPALQLLAQREQFLALEVQGTRYDIGGQFGWMQTQLALALAGRNREEMLATVLEVLADAARRNAE